LIYKFAFAQACYMLFQPQVLPHYWREQKEIQRLRQEWLSKLSGASSKDSRD
jgi:hypothetical protein